MEKNFENLKELMDFDFSELMDGKSNYLTILGTNGLPKIRKAQHFNKWRVVEKLNVDEPRILMEITPRWLTITVYQGEELKTRQASFEISRKNPKSVIQEVFEF